LLIFNHYESRQICILPVDRVNFLQTVSNPCYTKDSVFDYIILPKWLEEKGGKDISDFFTMGGTDEEFKEIILGKHNFSDRDKKDEPLSNIPLLEVTTSSNATEVRRSIRTAIQRIEDAKHQADILPHFGAFFQKNEFTIFFGDTGKGKSICAVSIADAISKILV